MNGADEAVGGCSDYEFDIFVSYTREPLLLAFIDGVVERLQYYVKQEVGGYEKKFFVDRNAIQVGDHWEDRLRSGVTSSRCMLGIWTPEYFQKPWCVCEWKSFVARDALVDSKHRALVAPVKIYKGWFPDEACKAQIFDLTELTGGVTTNAFWNSPRAVELDAALPPLAGGLAGIIMRAPPYRADWPFIHDAKPIDPPRSAKEFRRL